jgi:FKBP-type peptidyl-prolyl cis-trans isomerase 2
MAEVIKTKKGDFVEIEFVGYANGSIFDTNIAEKAKEADLKIEIKPLDVCIGKEMVVKGFDRRLEEKVIGEKYKIQIPSEEGFGKRNPSYIKIIPISAFIKQNMNPVSGMVLNLDGMIAKILSVNGGRVSVDFNNPLAGKEIEYEFTIKKIVSDENDKVNSLQDFFFRKRFKFKVEEKKIIFEAQAAPFIKIMGKKFREILGKEIEFEKKEDKKKESEDQKEEKQKVQESSKEDEKINHNTQK